MTQDKDQKEIEFEAWWNENESRLLVAERNPFKAVARHAWQAARASAQPKIDWHQQRWAALQQHQQMMREPERTIVCDVLANGQLLCGADGRIDVARYVSAPQGVPEGFALVPVEATPEMLNASRWSGSGDVSVNEEWARKQVWNRMIAAAPQTEAQKMDKSN